MIAKDIHNIGMIPQFASDLRFYNKLWRVPLIEVVHPTFATGPGAPLLREFYVKPNKA
jgi:hypothetical protein